MGVALRKLRLTGREAVMIGDTPYDAEAASGAGTAAAGVLSGGFTEEALRGAGCFAIAVKSPACWARLRIQRRPAGAVRNI